MTGFLMALGLSFTGFNMFNYAPHLNDGTGLVDTGSIEYQMNYQHFQREVIVEDFFTFAESLGNYNYARGCAGGYGPDRWDAEKQKQVRCSKKSFDCGGVIKAFGFIKGILDRREVGRNNTKTLYNFGRPISPYMAQRGDYTYWELVKGTGLATTHGAFVREELSGNILKIYDGLGGQFNERELILHCGEDSCLYNTNNGRYKIYFSTNPLWEISQNKGIEVQPFNETGHYSTGSVKEYGVCEVNPNNPLGFHIVISGYNYDSLANRIANRWYVRNKDKDMIRTYLCENGGFDPDAASQTNDSGLCQLNNHKGNYFWIKDPRRNSNDPTIQLDFQKQACLDKRNLVQDPKKIWTCARMIESLPDPIIELSGGFRSIEDK